MELFNYMQNNVNKHHQIYIRLDIYASWVIATNKISEKISVYPRKKEKGEKKLIGFFVYEMLSLNHEMRVGAFVWGWELSRFVSVFAQKQLSWICKTPFTKRNFIHVSGLIYLLLYKLPAGDRFYGLIT